MTEKTKRLCDMAYDSRQVLNNKYLHIYFEQQMTEYLTKNRK